MHNSSNGIGENDPDVRTTTYATMTSDASNDTSDEPAIDDHLAAQQIADPAAGPGALLVEFCGEVIAVDHSPFTIGRDADYVLDDDNRFLHRHFVNLAEHGTVWMLSNVGSQLTATVSDRDGLLEAFLAPGAALPLVFDETIVRFTAGPTTYEFCVRLADPAFQPSHIDQNEAGDTTIGRITMTPDQLRLILALAEPALTGTGRAATTLPSSGEAASRLGWTTTRFNRKLDNVCQRLAKQGVRGLHGAPGRLASNRRARLVEYAIAVRLITRDDLALLDQPEDE